MRNTRKTAMPRTLAVRCPLSRPTSRAASFKRPNAALHRESAWTSFLLIGCLTSDDCIGHRIGVRFAAAGACAGRSGGTEFLRTRHAKPAERRLKPGRIHAVLGALGRDIAREIIPAGAMLPPEHELESRFGVGRGVVREAIKTLSGKGLVSVRPRHGTRVLPRSDWSLLDR